MTEYKQLTAGGTMHGAQFIISGQGLLTWGLNTPQGHQMECLQLVRVFHSLQTSATFFRTCIA